MKNHVKNTLFEASVIITYKDLSFFRKRILKPEERHNSFDRFSKIDFQHESKTKQRSETLTGT